jgi:DNA transposition AAA+ family ATPase
MKTNYVITQNVKNLMSAFGHIHTQNKKANRMMMVLGDPGLGKTEAAMRYQINNPGVVYIRAKALISPRWMLEDLVRELGEQPMYRASALFGQAKEQLDKNPRLIIIDEADYLLHDPRAMETLRDLHDTTAAAFCIIGMELLDKKVARYRHLFDRFAEVVKFKELTLNDVKNVAAQNCEVKISDDAAAFIHKNTPRFRQVMNWLYKAENLAQANSLKEITAAHLEGRK